MKDTRPHHHLERIMAQYLVDNGRLPVSTLGMLMLDRRSATLDRVSDRIYPPHYDIRGRPWISTDALDHDRLMQVIADELQISHADADKLWQDYAEEMADAFSTGREWQIVGIGRFEASPPHAFHQDDDYWGIRSVDGLGLNLTPLPSHLRTSAELVASQPVAGDESTPAQEDAPMLSEQVDEESAETTEEYTEPSSMATVLSPPSVDKAPPDQSASEMRTASTMGDQTDKEGRAHFSSWLWWVLLLIGLVIIIGLIFGMPSMCQQDPPSVVSDDIVVDDTDKLEGTMPLDDDAHPLESTKGVDSVNSELETSTDNPSTQIDRPHHTVVDGRCVVIVGAYGRRANRVKMIERLEQGGYDVYVDSNRQLNRVGVFSECAPIDLKALLAEMRSEIEPSSWILE